MQWNSNATKPPKAGSYLVFDKIYGMCFAYYTKRRGWEMLDEFCEGLNTSVTHWAEVPDPPPSN
jgi:hypothetical protein